MFTLRRIAPCALLLSLVFAFCSLAAAQGNATTQPTAQQAQQQDTQSDQAEFDKARAAFARGQYAEATNTLNDFLKSRPDSLITDLALLWLARSYIQQNKLIEAEAVGTQLHKLQDSPLASIYDADISEARARLTQTVESVPKQEVAKATRALSQAPQPVEDKSTGPATIKLESITITDALSANGKF